jgi:hypothetical protein
MRLAETRPSRSLTVGPAVGAVRELFDKVKAINTKHGKFDLCVCVGDFFGPPAEDGGVSSEVQDLLDGKLEGARGFCL